MADDEFQATGNWWDSSSRNVRFETGPSHSSSFPNNFTNWQQIDHHHDLKPSISDSPPMIMGLGLSSNPIDWNNHNHLLRAEEKGVVSDGRFKSTFQENNNNLSSSGGSSNFHQQVEWREKLLFSTDSSSTTTTDNNNNQYSTTSGDSIVTTSHGLASSFQHMDSSANPSLLQGLLLAPEASSSSSSFDNNNHHHNRSCFNFPYNNDQLMPSWPKVSQFLRASNSPPKQTQHHGGNSGGGNSQLQFTNNASFWNASEANHHHHHHHAAIKEATRPSFFPNSLQPPFHHSPNFDAQSKNICGGRETSSVGKKSGGETAPKRARNETSSTLPPFKARKEKMGDRITALQQLVSPFGKTDTASVLSEAIEYIKFLHEQVSVLSTPYMKSGAPLQHQQSSGQCKEGGEALINQDLRSRGLCLVPVASTFPVTHETTVDFWMPTFGATFR